MDCSVFGKSEEEAILHLAVIAEPQIYALMLGGRLGPGAYVRRRRER